MALDLAGRVALVTGGNRGIGRAIALALAEGGADVAVVYRRDEDAAATTVKDVEALGRKARAYAADVGSPAEVEAMVAAVVADFGFVDILVNNAGVASRGRAVVDTDADEVERLLRIHAVGAHTLCRAVLPSMRTRPRGDIVMISSVITRDVPPNAAPYAMAKGALEMSAATASTSTSSPPGWSRRRWAGAWPRPPSAPTTCGPSTPPSPSAGSAPPR